MNGARTYVWTFAGLTLLGCGAGAAPTDMGSFGDSGAPWDAATPSDAGAPSDAAPPSDVGAASDAAVPSDATTDGGRHAACASECAVLVMCGVAPDVASCAMPCESSATDAQVACIASCAAGGSCTGLSDCVSACSGVAPTTGDPYGASAGPCPPPALGPACGSAVELCHETLDFDTGVRTGAVCQPYCESGLCPSPATGTATAVCVTTTSPAACELDCTGGATCPDGMVCMAAAGHAGGDLCVWPAS